MIKNELINFNHHGSVKARSTQTLVMELHDQMIEVLENGEEGAIISIDQSKAFEIVSHLELIKKMEAIGFDDSALDLMKSYLQERKQVVEINGKLSEMLLTGPDQDQLSRERHYQGCFF